MSWLTRMGRAIFRFNGGTQRSWGSPHLGKPWPIPLASYFCAVHPLGELFLCLPFNFPSFCELFSCQSCNSPSVHLFSKLFFVLSIPWASYFSAYHLIINPLTSYFLCRPFNSPFVHLFEQLLLWHPYMYVLCYFCNLHWYDEYYFVIIYLRFIWASIVMYWLIVQTEKNTNSSP